MYQNEFGRLFTAPKRCCLCGFQSVGEENVQLVDLAFLAFLA
jgi:hypothetical protein